MNASISKNDSGVRLGISLWLKHGVTLRLFQSFILLPKKRSCQLLMKHPEHFSLFFFSVQVVLYSSKLLICSPKVIIIFKSSKYSHWIFYSVLHLFAKGVVASFGATRKDLSLLVSVAINPGISCILVPFCFYVKNVYICNLNRRLNFTLWQPPLTNFQRLETGYWFFSFLVQQNRSSAHPPRQLRGSSEVTPTFLPQSPHLFALFLQCTFDDPSVYLR